MGTEDCLGQAGLVYEHILGENKFTYVEKCANPQSVTILMKGPNKHTLMQIKDAVRDGLRAVKNALKKFLETVKGRARLGIQAYAEGMMIIPKTLAQNSGYDAQESIVKLLQEGALNSSVG